MASGNIYFSCWDGKEAEEKGQLFKAAKFYNDCINEFENAEDPVNVIYEYHSALYGYSRCMKKMGWLKRLIFRIYIKFH